MLCDSCHQREATVHLTQVINGYRSEKHLCEQCADKYTENGPMNFGNIHHFFHNDMNSIFNAFRQGMSQFQPSGILSGLVNGEFNPQETFNGSEDIPSRIRVNLDDPEVSQMNQLKSNERSIKLMELHKKLNQMVDSENYEEAAKIRDEIHHLEKTGIKENSSES